MCFFFKQKTAYEMRISDWSSDVCSSDLVAALRARIGGVEEDAVALIDDRALGRAALQRHAAGEVDAVRPGDVIGEDVDRHRRIFGKLARNEIGRASCRERVCQYV